MATFDFSQSIASASTAWSHFGYLSIIASAETEFTNRTATGFTATWNGLTFHAKGTGFKYNADEAPKNGTVTDFEVIASGNKIIDLSGLTANIGAIKTAFAGGIDPYRDFFKAIMSKADTFKGSAHNDQFEAFGGSDMMLGNGGDDHLAGGAGKDTLNGGLGSDTLNGGNGQDHFRFTDALGNTNVDYIINFNAADDTIGLSNTIFQGIGADGNTLAASKFKMYGKGDKLDADDRIIYVQSSGDLFYDADGNGAQGAVKFAHLEGAPALTHADFLII
jgi:Ca2+-binding RTX toxin-like protein